MPNGLAHVCRSALWGAAVLAASVVARSASGADSSYTNTNTPAEILAAYKIGALQATHTGAGQTIAIYTDSYYSTLQSDVDYFSDKYMGGTSTTVSVWNTSGANLTGQNSDSTAAASASPELALDVEYAHLIAPGATIKVVVGGTSYVSTAKYAANSLGASVFSISYGSHTTSSSYTVSDKASMDSGFASLSKTTILAAAGDSGTLDYPASSSYAVAVGGTNLTTSDSGTYRSETGWGATSNSSSGSGGGGGPDVDRAMPAYQVGAIGTTRFGNYRVGPDVSIAGGNLSSLPVFCDAADADDYGYHYGSSIATPMWAGLIADADQARAANGLAALSTLQTLDALYATYTNGLYGSVFHDVVGGTNSSGDSATTGYDALTGLGSPIADELVGYLATVPAPEPTSLLALAPAAAGLIGTRRRRRCVPDA